MQGGLITYKENTTEVSNIAVQDHNLRDSFDGFNRSANLCPENDISYSLPLSRIPANQFTQIKFFSGGTTKCPCVQRERKKSYSPLAAIPGPFSWCENV